MRATRAISICRSMRSSSGPESSLIYCETRTRARVAPHFDRCVTQERHSAGADADLAAGDAICAEHVAEAIPYRSLERLDNRDAQPWKLPNPLECFAAQIIAYHC